MDIKQLVKESHETAVEKGWYHEGPRPIPELIALVHSELSEALEDYRNGYAPNDLTIDEKGKPCGFPSELADVLIRVADMCGAYEIDIEAAVIAKLAFNKTRSHRHGGKKV